MSSAFLPTPTQLHTSSGKSSRHHASDTASRRRPRMSVHRIRNPTDFAAALPPSQANPLSPLVVFSFITRGCRACSYASNAYARMANDFSLEQAKKGREVRFCEMDVSERQNQKLGQSLGVNAVPSFQLYAFKKDGKGGGVGVLDEMVGPRMVGKVKEKLAHYLSDGFKLEDYVFED